MAMASRTHRNAAQESDRRPERSHAGVTADESIQQVARIEENARQARTQLDHAAGVITEWAGSAASLVLHTVWFAAWVLCNVRVLPRIAPFDPFPFSLLTTIVSLEAIFLSLFVLISQNRLSKEADKRALLDLQVNLLAERESTMTLRMLQEISGHLGLKGQTSKDLETLLQETHVEELAKKLEQAIPSE
jgi:uncharacterized membrane protein